MTAVRFLKNSEGNYGIGGVENEKQNCMKHQFSLNFIVYNWQSRHTYFSILSK